MREVLLVDDAKFMRNLYRALLEETPVTVVAEATNGVEGVDAYKEHDPDVVVMNVRMPVLDGIDATEEIVAYDPDATVVICSGNRQEEKMRAAVEAGAADYLTKPFQRDGFLNAVTGPNE
ncbi:response regulator [Halovenus salina]|uniref:Response regulator n=1 Tax=Halovenus salina TaxID=1510225 RepID=A0ABD5W4Y6_9EURY|nr:response regulator [Halovenus salina]